MSSSTISERSGIYAVRQQRLPWRMRPGLAVAMLMSLAAAATAAGPVHPVADQVYVLINGVTKPVYHYTAAIRESVWVQVPELESGGRPLQVVADIIRPRELDGIARVPVIMVASPYYLCCGRGQ